MEIINLTEEQQQQAWNWACQDGNYPVESFDIQDFLGAKIERPKYGKDDIHGWCVEYVIPPSELNSNIKREVDPFTHANVRVLNIGNYQLNKSHRPGEYNAYVVCENGNNKKMFAYQISKISNDGIKFLKDTYGLSDDFLQSHFNL